MNHILIDTQTGAVKKYPYGYFLLVQDNPNTSFPSVMSDAQLQEWGVMPVDLEEPPSVGHDQTVEEGAPVFRNGRWVRTWNVAPATASEISGRALQKAAEVRAQRDQMLRDEVDTINAVRWASMTQAERDAAMAKRQALLDIPQQPGFPWSVQWPQ